MADTCRRCPREREPGSSVIQNVGGAPVCVECYSHWVFVRARCESLFLRNVAFVQTDAMPLFLASCLAGELGPEIRGLAAALLEQLSGSMERDLHERVAAGGGADPGVDRGGGGGAPQLPPV